jgi:hypothetical protein
LAGLGFAALAVLFVAFVVGRDFIADVYPQCGGSLEPRSYVTDGTPVLESVGLETGDSGTPAPGRSFHLLYDTKINPRIGYNNALEYSNVRIVMADHAVADGRPCACGAIPIFLSGEAPADLRLYRVKKTDQYVVKGRPSAAQAYVQSDDDVRVSFIATPYAARSLQTNRIFTQRHVGVLVVLFAFVGLGVALLRSRRAMSYALRLHTWTEARLTSEGMIQNEEGITLGTLAQGSSRRLVWGPILVAPDAISTAGLYRDMPIVAPTNVAEGTHARWASGTMQRLRDARALAILSTTCTVLALGARLIGG